MFNHHDITRNAFMLLGPLAQNGYDWWCVLAEWSVIAKEFEKENEK